MSDSAPVIMMGPCVAAGAGSQPRRRRCRRPCSCRRRCSSKSSSAGGLPRVATCKAVWGSWMSRAPGYRGRGMLRRNGSYRVSCGARTGRSLASKGLVSRQCAAGGRPVCDPRVQANGLPAHGASRGSTPLVSEWLQGRRDGGRALREQLEGPAARYLLVRPRVATCVTTTTVQTGVR